MERDYINSQNKMQDIDDKVWINEYQIKNLIQNYKNNNQDLHGVEEHLIFHLAKCKIMNFTVFKKIMEIPEVKSQLLDKEQNARLNTLDIMRNYLHSEEMAKILAYLTEELGMTNISSLVITVNELASVDFLQLNEGRKWQQLQSLLLSRNNIAVIELSDLLVNLPSLRLLDLSQNFIEVFQTKQVERVNSQLVQLNMSRNRICYVDAKIVKNRNELIGDVQKSFLLGLSLLNIPTLKQLYLFGNYIQDKRSENNTQPKSESIIIGAVRQVKESFPNIEDFTLHGNPCIDENDDEKLDKILFHDDGSIRNNFFNLIN